MPQETKVKIENVVYSLAASPAFEQDGICFAARMSGLLRSEDGGLSWQDAYASLNLEAPLATLAVGISPNFAEDRTVFAGVPGGVLRSIDGGQSWQAANLPSPPPLVSSLVVSPNFTHDGVVLVGTVEDGVYRSGDRGHHWAGWNFGLMDLNVLCMAISPNFANDETLFAGTESGIFRSTNGGRAWRPVPRLLERRVAVQADTPLPIDFAPVLSLALSPRFATDGVLFAGTESCGLYRSSDQGNTWEHLGEDVIDGVVNGILLSPQFPAQPDVLVLLGNGLLISRDSGRSWAKWAWQLADQSAGIQPEGLACVAAPRGLEHGATLLVGNVEGRVTQIR